MIGSLEWRIIEILWILLQKILGITIHFKKQPVYL